MPARRAVVFDLDDTLYPEHAYTLSGLRAVAEAYGPRLGSIAELLARFQTLLDSPDRTRIFNVVVAERCPHEAETLVPEMVATFRAHRPTHIALFPEAAAALDRLAAHFALGLISDGFLEAQKAKINALGIRDRFDAIILTDEWGRAFWKPHPRAFEEIARRLDVAHSACVYVADNLAKDFVAPNALGWRTIRFVHPGAVHKDKPAPPCGAPQFTVDSLADVDALCRQ